MRDSKTHEMKVFLSESENSISLGKMSLFLSNISALVVSKKSATGVWKFTFFTKSL